jgi:hypothetical protein
VEQKINSGVFEVEVATLGKLESLGKNFEGNFINPTSEYNNIR